MAKQRTYSEIVGRKYGALTVLKVMLGEKKENGKGYEDAMCVCSCSVCGGKCMEFVRKVTTQYKKDCGCRERNKVLMERRKKLLRKAVDATDDIAIALEYAAVNKPSKQELLTDNQRPAVVVQLGAVLECKRDDITACLRNNIAHLCCYECDKKNRCGRACKRNPVTCGKAKVRK